MGEYHIQGGNRLQGEIRVSGSKNAVLPMFAAMVLNGSESILHNCPLIQDTYISIEILKHIGCTVKLEGNTVIVYSGPANGWNIPDKYTSQMRSSVLFMGGLVGRFGRAEISFPGGCELGDRPINMHTNAMMSMGCAIQTGDMLRCRTAGRSGAAGGSGAAVGSGANMYIDFLKSGSSDYSIDILTKAGVDMSKPEPVKEALVKFGELLTEMEAIL